MAAASLGADAIGLNFYPASPRAVSVGGIAEIVNNLPATLEVVALFVNPDPRLVDTVVESGMIDSLQFHGEEDARFCASFGLPFIKAIRVGAPGNEPLSEIIESFAAAKLIILDSFDFKAPGGTGKLFDWQLLGELETDRRSKLVIAGGLNATNVAAAIHTLDPYGVDVAGGVETSHGIKDQEKMRRFIEVARRARA